MNLSDALYCPCCGQRTRKQPRVKRFGVEFTYFKARIIDVVRRAGPDGIHGDDLFGIIYGNARGRERTYRALTMAIYCINEQLKKGGPWRIRGRYGAKTWHLRKVA